MRFAQDYEGGGDFTYEASDALYSALATLPALESIGLSAPPESQIALDNAESLTELLEVVVPSLWSVCFSESYFTSDVC
jgi:hypothetical protein